MRIGRAHKSLVVVGLALGLVVLFGRVSRAQVRDRPVRPQPAGASLSGRAIILIDGHEQPVRRARVAVTPDGGNAHTTQTDTDGAFRFDGLAAGTYRTSVDKAGFVQSSAQEPIELTRGDTKRLTVTMVPGSSVSGRITLDTGEPIANVVVTAERVVATGGRQADPHFAETDDLGRFRLHTLSSGRYLLRTRSDTVKADVYYPGTALAEDGHVVTLATGQEIEGVDLVLASVPANVETQPNPLSVPPGTSSITGLVYWSDTRKPATGVTVRAVSGGRRPATTTDQNGQFMFVNLGPGRYTVVAETARTVGLPVLPPADRAQGVLIDLHDGEALGDVQVPLSPRRTIAGRVLDEFGDPVPGVKVIIGLRVFGFGRFVPGAISPGFSANTTDDRGRFRFSGLEPGQYYLRTQQTSDLFTVVQAPSGFAPTFFPRATELAQASTVRVVDRDALTADVSLVPAPMTAVAGVVLNVAGNPYSGASVSIGDYRSTRSAADGTFAARDLPAGSYKISTTTYEGVGEIIVDLPPESNDRPLHVTVTTRPFATIRGRVVFDGDAPSGWRTSTRLGFFTAASAVDNSIKFSDDGSFAIQSITRPAYLHASAPPGWKLESVTVDAQDVTDTEIDFTHDLSNLEVVFTHRLGSVTGAVTEGAKPVSAAMVVLFPEDLKRQAFPSRYTSVARTLFTGAFTITDLLPGSYYALAVPLFLGDPDPDELEKMRPLATLVQVGEQEETKVSLSLVR